MVCKKKKKMFQHQRVKWKWNVKKKQEGETFLGELVTLKISNRETRAHISHVMFQSGWRISPRDTPVTCSQLIPIPFASVHYINTKKKIKPVWTFLFLDAQIKDLLAIRWFPEVSIWPWKICNLAECLRPTVLWETRHFLSAPLWLQFTSGWIARASSVDNTWGRIITSSRNQLYSRYHLETNKIQHEKERLSPAGRLYKTRWPSQQPTPISFK